LKTIESGQWQRTSPFAVLFFFGKVLQTIMQNAWQSFAPFAAFVYAYEGELATSIVLGGIAFLAITTTVSVLNYWFFRFQLNEDSILIRQGVIKKKQLDIKFDRIQGINTQQNFVFRFFGLVTIKFDTAGSSGNEGNLPAVSRKFAQSLRARISNRGTSEDVEEVVPDADPLLTLGWRDIVRIGLSDRRALLVFAAISPLIERIDDDAYGMAINYVENAAGDVFQASAMAATVLFIAAAIGLITLLGAISVAAAFLRYYNFELYLDGSNLRSRGGLLTQHEVSMHLGKIQTLRLQQGVVMRLLNKYHLSARQARSSHKQGKSKNFIVPIVTGDVADHLRELLLEPEGDQLTQIPTSNRFRQVSPYYMRTRFLVVSLLPTIIATAVFSQMLGAIGLAFLLWLPASALLIYQSWRRDGYHCSNEGIVRRSGVLGYRSVALLYRKVQRVTVSQSRYQRRKKLATLRVYMASGSVKIPYIGHDTAKQLRDYILYKVESSQQAWH
jgi:putative membrane protein